MRRAIQSTVSRRPPLLPTRPLLRNTTTTTIITTTTTTTSTTTTAIVGTNGWRSYASSVSGNGGSSSDGKQNKMINDERWKKPSRVNWDGFRKTNKHFKPRGKSQKKGQKQQEEEKEEKEKTPPEVEVIRTLADTELSFEQWQQINERIASFSQLLDESSVAPPESLGKNRLVDTAEYCTNIKLWQILLKFRRRLYEDAGVREIWDGLRLRRMDLPTEGASADELWDVFLRSAARDDAFMDVVWGYIQELDTRAGRAWNGVYDAVVGRYLVTDPVKARKWHYNLCKRHASRSLPELFAEVLALNPDAHPYLRIIHATTKKPAGVYTTMIPSLCKLALHPEAVRWHQHCLSFDDLPEDTSAADELVSWVARYGTINELHQLMYSFVKMNVPMRESTLTSIILARPDKMEALRFILARSNEFDTKAMGDHFWAQVISKHNIDKEDVYRYLCTFAVGLTVGRHTVEAAAKRFDIAEDKAVWLLTEIGIKILEGDLMPLDVSEDEPEQSPMYRDPTAYRHPRNMAELSKALQSLIKAKDWQSFDELLSRPLPGPPDAALSNVLLQSDLSRGRLQEALHRFEQMRLSSTLISTPSIQLLISTLLRPRRRGHYPNVQPWYIEDDTFLVMGLLFSLLRSEVTKVEPHLWEEIFKRLGMMRRLEDIETLAFALLDWYHPTRAPDTRRRYATAITPPPRPRPQTVAELVADAPAAQKKLTPIRPTEVADISRHNPLRIIFDHHFFQSIVEWGFLTYRVYNPEKMPLIPRPPSAFVRRLPKRYKEWNSCVPVFTWGIELARRLREEGVYVDPRVIQRALRVRLAPVFRPADALETPLKSNQLGAALLGYLDLEQIMKVVKKAWGKRLYEVRIGWDRHIVPNRRLCECGKEMFVVEDGERQKRERAKKEASMRAQVVGTASPEGVILRRMRRDGGAGEMTGGQRRDTRVGEVPRWRKRDERVGEVTKGQRSR
ncbi:uncharacterized protein LAJ45_02763 [Morchella importuna]|uniref:uncharacterized protein n=1 Tax=Morchella importuna TaxID=1174673 RepID=UPI001E8ED610|nr:uncharacterized protein LAJ45_02763 [Morchella importuna]KAH8153176.1 hypothetical protein LAJ45_02763 [Morchella importuna]